MKITTVTLLAVLGCSMVHAQGSHNTALKSAANGKAFTMGSADFRIVPGASLQRSNGALPGASDAPPAPASRSAKASAAPVVLGTIGPYSIVPGSSAKTRAGTAAPSSQPPNTGRIDMRDLAVAVNMRTGQPAVVKPQLKIFAGKASDIAGAAKQTGGTVVYASDTDGSGLIRYSSVDVAQTALEDVRKAPGVRGASLDVIEQFKEKK